MNLTESARLRRGGRWPVTGSGQAELFAISRLPAEECFRRLDSQAAGLAAQEAAERLADHGLNLVTRERNPTVLQEIWSRAKNPLNALLLTLAIVSWLLGDLRAAMVIALIVLL